jgi:8-amino-7-oxononanoate synthase
MADFSADLNQRLNQIREQGLYRQLRRIDSAQSPCLQIGGQRLLNFASNDYLGLANDPILKAAAIQAVEQFGAGSGASRLVSGTLAPHIELEHALAAFKGAEAALAFSSGYAAAIGTLAALIEKSDIVILDKLVHACLVDAARLCGARLRVFAHNDLDDLEKKLRWADYGKGDAHLQRRTRIIVVTESVFSMDGDHAPLDQIVELKEKYGAWLMVDEAHATGLYGPNRRGLAEQCGLADRIEIQMGTLSKALGSSGGFICGSRALVELLINRARSFIFSTAPTPASAAAATAAIRFVQSPAGEERCQQLWQRVDQVRAKLGVGQELTTEMDVGAGGRRQASGPRSAIFPILIGDERQAIEAAKLLYGQGIFIPAIRYPAVARGAARLRLAVSAAHSAEDVGKLLGALAQLKSAFGIRQILGLGWNLALPGARFGSTPIGNE